MLFSLIHQHAPCFTRAGNRPGLWAALALAAALAFPGPLLAADTGGKTGSPSSPADTDCYTGVTPGGDYATSGATVNIDTGGTNININGGYSIWGNSVNNTVTMSAGAAATLLAGGFLYTTNGSAVAQNNTTTLNGGSTTFLFGARSFQNGTVQNNYLYINGGTVNGTGAAAGGWVDGNGGYGGDANGNIVQMSGGDVHTALYGGYTVSGNAVGNSTTVTGGIVDRAVFGGFSRAGNVADNTATLDGGTITDGLAGGRTHAGDATNNTATLNSGSVYAVWGGGISNLTNDAVGNASGNTVIINGGTVNDVNYPAEAIVGGYAQNGNATGNTVTINDVVFLNTWSNVHGGYSWNGSATGNRVNINGGDFSNQGIFGGFVLNGTGDATGNTVSISGSPILTGAWIHGGDGMSSGDLRTGNTLEIRTTGLNAENVLNFEHYRFILPGTVKPGDTALTLTEAAGTDISNSTVRVGIVAGAYPLRDGQNVTLLRNANGLTSTGYKQVKLTGTQGVSLEYDFALSATPTTLDATLVNSRPAHGAKAPAEGAVAAVAMTSMGSDLAAGEGMRSAQAATGGAGAAGGAAPYGLAAFGAATGGQSRYITGSHVDAVGAAFMVGLAKRFTNESGSFLAGLFFETGHASLSTHNTYDNAPSIDGKGHSRYYGGGVLLRYDVLASALKGLYAEASFRVGGLSGDWYSDDVRDAASGNRAEYDYSMPYYGAHVGVGYVWNITEKASLDVYGKYFWLHTGEYSTHVANDPWDFEAVNSHRPRVGARVNYAVTEQVAPYVGAAWEHEFNGKARATAYGVDMPAPSLKGDTGVFELA